MWGVYNGINGVGVNGNEWEAMGVGGVRKWVKMGVE